MRGMNDIAQRVSDSTTFKLIERVVMLIVLPIIAWGVNALTERMTSIEGKLEAYGTTQATQAIRMDAAERTLNSHSVLLDQLRTTQQSQGYRIDRLEEIAKDRALRTRPSGAP